MYTTYLGDYNDNLKNKKAKTESIITLGAGAYRIGASVEFDWCGVSCTKAIQDAEINSIMINCNPETVSTDFNCSDRLYFEELNLERILDICEFEKTKNIILAMGGQLPTN